MKKLNSDLIGMNTNELGEWVDEYYKFLNFYDRNQMPLMTNAEGMTKAQFHYEEGRGGYFAPESGTSESQLLAIKASLELYKATSEIKWLDMATKMMDKTIEVNFRNKKLPETFDEFDLWVPHWLYNAADDFISEKFYLSKRVSFKNGRASFRSDYTARKIFTVRALDATLLWENPFSEIIGRSYAVQSFSAQDKTFTVELEEKYTGDLLVVYSDMGGEIIKHNEPYEAWPIWRKLEDSEIDCAVDSLWWLYDAVKAFAEATKEEKWVKTLNVLKQTIPNVMQLANAEDWITSDPKTKDPFSLDGTYVYQSQQKEATLERNKLGNTVINISSGEGQFQLGRGGLDRTFTEESTVKMRLKSNISSKVSLIISTSNDYDESTRYTTTVDLKGGELKEFEFSREDFIQLENVSWYPYYLPQHKYSLLHSPNSTISATVAREATTVQFRRNTELDSNGNSFLGWAQFQPTFDKSNSLSELPNINYSSTGKINVRIKDSNNRNFYATLPESASFVNKKFSTSNFENGGSIVFPLKEFLFEAVDKVATLKLKYVGKLGVLPILPIDSKIKQCLLSVDEKRAQTITLSYIRPTPVAIYKYVPYVAPFTVNILEGQMVDWRGNAYTGYQAPYIWQELGNSKALKVNLDFMQDAQDEYEKAVGIRGFFMPVYLWDRWDSADYGEGDTWSWIGADPNTHWGGFQYRALEATAKVLHLDPTNEQAMKITLDFLYQLYSMWPSADKPILTTFKNGEIPVGEYDEAHMASLVLRAEYYVYQATKDKAVEDLMIERMKISLAYLSRLRMKMTDNMKWNSGFLNGTWTYDNQSWYTFWGAEILTSLSLIMYACESDFTIMTSLGEIDIQTEPLFSDLGDEYAVVKTPIGMKKVKLFDEDEHSLLNSPLTVETKNGTKKIGKGKDMNKYIRLLVKNASNAMKKTSVSSNISMDKLADGVLKIDSLKGQTLENVSNRKSYDYSTGNWANTFTNLKPNTEYNLSFIIEQTADTMLSISMKDSSGSDYGWMDIRTMADDNGGNTYYFGFTTGEDIREMMLYQQDASANTKLTNIMIVESKKEIPHYFEGELSFAENGFEIKVMDKANNLVDSLKISEFVPEKYLPLRRNGDVYDEIKENVLYKRISSSGSVMDEQKIVLTKPFSLLEVNKGCRVVLIEPNNVLADIELYYPIKFSDL